MGRWIIMLVVALALSAPVSAARADKSAARSAADSDKRVEEKLDKLGPMLSEIGHEAASLVGGDPDGLFIYAEVVDGQPHVVLCRNRDKSVRVYRGSQALSDLVEQVWALADRDPLKRWVVMEYEVQDTKFDTLFRYAEEIDPAVASKVRFRSVLDARFGRKRLIRDASLREDTSAQEAEALKEKIRWST